MYLLHTGLLGNDCAFLTRSVCYEKNGSPLNCMVVVAVLIRGTWQNQGMDEESAHFQSGISKGRAALVCTFLTSCCFSSLCSLNLRVPWLICSYSNLGNYHRGRRMGWLCHTVNWFLVWVIGWYFEPNLVSIHLDLLVEEHPFHQKVTLLLGEGGPNPLTFVLNANLLVNVKLITCKYCTFSFPLNPAFYFFFLSVK